MKRLVLIVAVAILLLISGCAGNTPGAVSATNSSPSLTPSASNPPPGSSESVAPVSNAPEKQWPTKSWSVSSPEAQGISSAGLEKANQRILNNYPNVFSLLVVRHGYLVYEKYYLGRDETSANPVYSVTKSVLSALTGIAIQQKLIKSADQPVSELLPDYFTGIDDKGKKEITVKDVLTMSGGLESIDSDYTSFFSSPDWLTYTLSKPLTDKPGTKFAYNTGLTQILSNTILKASGMDTKQYAEKYLFSPLGITVDRWDTDRTGHYGGGTGLYMTPRDMAKFGYLYLNNGLWDGKQIVPANWVAESTKKQIPATEGRDYGYLFWLQTAHDSKRNINYDTYRADGAGGQRIVVIPALDLVAVVTAENNVPSGDGDETINIIFNYVLPAVQ